MAIGTPSNQAEHIQGAVQQLRNELDDGRKVTVQLLGGELPAEFGAAAFAWRSIRPWCGQRYMSLDLCCL
jgi:hypothetical protein